MPHLLSRLLRRTSAHTAWLLPSVLALFVFVTGWVLMAWAQPGSDIVQPETYWWWFLVTTTTVGYGDFFPTAPAGQLVGGYVILGGLATVAVLITQISGLIENAKGRRMQGQTPYSGSDHLVILGYEPGRTERLLAAVLEDDAHREVVLCAWDEQAATDPMPTESRVHFVRGDLAESDVLERAALHRASDVLVDARNDDESVTLTVAAQHAAPAVHLVVGLRDLGRRRTVERVAPNAQCVQWHAVRMVTEELQDPGIARVYAQLAEPGGTGTFSGVLPAGVREATYADWHAALGRTHAATLLAVHDGRDTLAGTDWSAPVGPGSRLYYVATRRLGTEELAAALG
ncbi:NAD-binding protein [Nocardioides panacisoli]|uniref:potassium channel family protein n=1 Tax=Nocardioides panacisoli TaxID=627624 RepID=UPI001C62BEBF|nr:potassium channel family protein [Nocardioides panacisoli]QYJ03118.1 NAD-binding protein [Nocardioides panacisoli]